MKQPHRTGLLLIILVLSIALPARPEGRSEINQDLPKWLNLGVQWRLRSEGTENNLFQPDTTQNFLLMRTRLSVSVQPLHWLEFFGEGQDARAFGDIVPTASVKDRFDLRQAYVHFGTEGGWWEAKVGRQRIAFGGERLVGGSEWTNPARTFDAVRFTLHHKNNRVDIFSSSVVNADLDNWDHHRQGNDLHGIYAQLGSVIPNFKLEPYLLWRLDHSAKSHSWTPGVRLTGTRGRFTFDNELVGQKGVVGANNLSAWATTVQVQYKLPGKLPYQPSLLGEYNYASGGKDPGVVHTFDQLYPTNHGIYGIVDAIGRRNTQQVRGGLWIRPNKWLTLKGEGHSFWLANQYDGLYAANGTQTIAAPATGAISMHIGNEADILAEIKASKRYDIGIQYGHLFAGDFINQYAKGTGRGFYAGWIDFHI
jgi:hypothetical protein